MRHACGHELTHSSIAMHSWRTGHENFIDEREAPDEVRHEQRAARNVVMWESDDAASLR